MIGFMIDAAMFMLPSLIVGWILPQPQWAADLQDRAREWIKNKLFG